MLPGVSCLIKPDSSDKKYDNAGTLHKNPLAVACIIEQAFQNGDKSMSLERLTESINNFAEKYNHPMSKEIRDEQV